LLLLSAASRSLLPDLVKPGKARLRARRGLQGVSMPVPAFGRGAGFHASPTCALMSAPARSKGHAL